MVEDYGFQVLYICTGSSKKEINAFVWNVISKAERAS